MALSDRGYYLCKFTGSGKPLDCDSENRFVAFYDTEFDQFFIIGWEYEMDKFEFEIIKKIEFSLEP